MWFSSLFSRVRADRSSASRKQRGRRPNSRRDRFRPQIEPLEDRLAPALMIVGSLTDAPVNLADATVTLRDAIFAANNDVAVSPGGPIGSGTDEIQFQSGLTGTIPLSQGELAITSNLRITGPGAANLTINGNNASRIFNVDDGAAGPTINVEIIGLMLTGGTTLDSGGAIFSVENVTVSDAVIIGNSAVFEGGGIFHDGSGTFTVNSSTLSNNSAGNISDTDNGGGPGDTGGGGGAIANAGLGTVTVTNSILSDNSTGVFGDGGAIWNFVGTVSLTNSILSGNSAEFGGGIISFDGSTLTVTNSTLSGNSASDTGGGICSGNSTVTVTNSTLSGNSAVSAGGGGIFSFPGGTVTFMSSTLSGNSAGDAGGGIGNDGSTLTVTNSTLSDNSATNDGGGIWNVAHGTATVTSSTLSGNSAGDDGGGIFNASNAFGGMLTLNNTIVANSGSGGQIFNDVGGILAGSNNLIEGETPVGLAGTITADPKLGPLQNNGGPTQTHRLLLGSPAIDKGSNLLVPVGVTTDQRGAGFPRFVDGDDNGTAIVDIGAFEFHSPAGQVEDLDAFIDELVAGGSLNHGQGNALTKKKENALKKIENGQLNAAINELNAFVNQVQAFVKTGTLSASEGAALLAAVNELLATITP